jgi:hypothetical protein
MHKDMVYSASSEERYRCNAVQYIPFYEYLKHKDMVYSASSEERYRCNAVQYIPFYEYFMQSTCSLEKSRSF